MQKPVPSWFRNNILKTRTINQAAQVDANEIELRNNAIESIS